MLFTDLLVFVESSLLPVLGDGVLFGIAVILLGISVRFGVAHKALKEEMKIQDECLAHAGGQA